MEHHSEQEEHPHNDSHEQSAIFHLIRTRRSVRKYKDKQVPFGLVAEILQSAKYAPFAGNVFNCKLIVVKNEDKRKAISEASAQQLWMADAPIHIVVVGEPEKAERYYDTRGVRLYTIQGIAAAVENMLLTAHSLGLGTCWVGAFDEEEIRRLCNLPEHVDIHAVITVGYPDERPEPPPKYRIEHYMFFEKWWGRIEGPKNALGMWAPYFKKAATETHKIVRKKGKKLIERIKEKLRRKEK